MFQTTFQHASSTPLPPNISIANGIHILHHCETVLRFSPDCRGCKPIPSSQAKVDPHQPANARAVSGSGTDGPEEAETQYYEVEDDLPFIPKALWSGGVRYQADFNSTQDGCVITVHAPGGFTSVNRWRLLREAIPEDHKPTLERGQSKDMLHATTDGSGWYVQIVSDARCNRTFAGFVKGFLKNSHQQLQRAYIEKLQSSSAQQSSGRPTLGRRMSSQF